MKVWCAAIGIIEYLKCGFVQRQNNQQISYRENLYGKNE